jgi:hypothetical protein
VIPVHASGEAGQEVLQGLEEPFYRLGRRWARILAPAGPGGCPMRLGISGFPA